MRDINGLRCQRNFTNCCIIAIGTISGVPVCRNCLEYGELKELKKGDEIEKSENNKKWNSSL